MGCLLDGLRYHRELSAMKFATAQSPWIRRFVVSGAIFIAAAGCSGRPKNVAKSVRGKVTLGGQPLAGATVGFAPIEGGSAAVGQTDATGNYKLIWGRSGSRLIEGAQIGENTVNISTFVEGAPSAKPPRPEVPEKVPYKYRTAEGALKATVKRGSNVINFDLEPGPVQPPPPPKGKTKGKAK
jgi:hypothetical protein